MDGSCHIHETSSTYRSTTSRDDDMKNNAPFLFTIHHSNFLVILGFIIYFNFCYNTFFKPKGQDFF